ncbi:MAG: hypothetical protein ACPL0A_01945, partial [Candidatus Micrarchaeia archaeon]
AKRSEIEEVKEWCRKQKEKRKIVPIIDMNPFRTRFEWMFARIKIAIDLPLDDAKPDMAVYDSTTNNIYIFVNKRWIQVEPEDIFEV